MNSDPFAEVIESSLDFFLAQSWQWNKFPRFGSLVQVKGDSILILGCVSAIKTGSMDPMRYPFPYQKTEEELLSEQPQIFQFLKTTFTVKILGYLDKKDKIKYRLPPYPCKIHAFVNESLSQFSASFFSRSDFLYPLFSSSSQITNFDDLLLAIFNQLSKEKRLTDKMLDSFCKTFSLLTGNDYCRMKMFLRRIEQI